MPDGTKPKGRHPVIPDHHTEPLCKALDILDRRISEIAGKSKDLRCPITWSQHYRNTGAAVVERATDLLDDCLSTLGGDELSRLRIALADAIRRPMGVIPDSAQGLLSDGDLDLAEVRRLRGSVPFCAPPAPWADGQELV